LLTELQKNHLVSEGGNTKLSRSTMHAKLFRTKLKFI